MILQEQQCSLTVLLYIVEMRIFVYLDLVSKPAIFRSPNQLSYYPGEYVTLMCVLQDIYADDQIEYQYRWSFAPEIGKMNGMNFPGSDLTLVPHYNEAGNYTCYANTSSTYTIESQGNGTTINVLRKLVKITKH